MDTEQAIEQYKRDVVHDLLGLNKTSEEDDVTVQPIVATNNEDTPETQPDVNDDSLIPRATK
jgi:hypothetical protein